MPGPPAVPGLVRARRAAQGVHALADCLLTQAGAQEAAQYAGAVDERHGGLVVSGTSALSEVRRLRDSGFGGALLVDPQRYKGSRRSYAADGMAPGAAARQLYAGATVALSDSGYIPAGDVAALDAVLAAATSYSVEAVPVLPMPTTWLADPDDRQRLAERVIASKVKSVAVILEHSSDPLGARAALAGALAIVALPVKLLVLRCDGSAIGLLAHGAHAASVGVRSGLRHLYPVKEGGGGPRPGSSEAAYFQAGMSFLDVGKLALGVARDPEDPRWSCYCDTHAGRNVGDLLTWPDVDIRRHSATALLREQQALSALPRWQRSASWQARVASALSTYDEMNAVGIAWRPPAALRHWNVV
jgi:hypothetical protein